MKCSSCGKDSNFKERARGACQACGVGFVFEPRAGDPVTDAGFAAAIARVSGDGTVKFTGSNLFHEVTRPRQKSKARWVIPGLSAVGALPAFASGLTGLGMMLAVLGSVTSLVLLGVKNPREKLLRGDFDSLLERWQTHRGGIPGLISRARPTAASHAPAPAELEDYSFDRAVITDTAETAELLLANDFHFENNCAVLSLDGAPAHAFEPVRRMLRKNPRLEVFALHDGTPSGCLLAWKLKRDPAWFKEFGTVRDVALRPRQAQAPRFKRFLRRAEEEVPANHPALTREEVTWLASWQLPLAVIRPEQLIKRLYKAMQSTPAGSDSAGFLASDSPDPSSTSSSSDGDGVALWSTDALASDGGADSFG